MKKITSLLFFVFLSYNSFAQCYTTVVYAYDNIIARRTDGTLWARGRNSYGNAGNGTTGFLAQFSQIGVDVNWTNAISASNNKVFAIKSDGTLWVWGSGIDFGLGNSNSYTNLTPTQVGTDTNWLTIADDGTPLAVKTDGTLWAWGGNYDGRLGNGNTDDNFTVNVPTQVGTASNWQKVYSNGSIRLAIKTDGTLWSWGSHYNSLGYLNSNLNNAYRTPHQVGNDANWIKASVGLGGFIAALKTDGTLWAWGFSGAATNPYLFGNGLATYSTVTPIQIGTDTNWKSVSAAYNNIIALKTNGTRWGWGENQYYQLGQGIGINTIVTIPTQLDTDTDWAYITNDNAGDTSSLNIGIKQNNSLYYWGYLFPGGAGFVYTPTLIGTLCTLNLNDFNQNNTFLVYPNPIENYVNIRFNDSKSENLEIQITNSLGQVVFERDMVLNNTFEFQLNISNLQTGLYSIRMKNEKYHYTTKIMKN